MVILKGIILHFPNFKKTRHLTEIQSKEIWVICQILLDFTIFAGRPKFIIDKEVVKKQHEVNGTIQDKF